MNEPPVLLIPEGEAGEEFIVDLDTSPFVIVIVSDLDSPQIDCGWVVPGEENPRFSCNAEANGEFVSTLTLNYDAELDGELVVAHLSDALSLAEITVNFRVFVGGEF